MKIPKRLRQLLCDHDYEIVKQDYYLRNKKVVMYQRYICKKCGHNMIEEFVSGGTR